MEASKCPKCGAAYDARDDSYKCGSYNDIEVHECTRRQLERVRGERDEWHKDRDRVLLEQRPWMKMVEAIYPDNEYDFGEALTKIINELAAERAKVAERDRRLGIIEESYGEVADWARAAIYDRCTCKEEEDEAEGHVSVIWEALSATPEPQDIHDIKTVGCRDCGLEYGGPSWIEAIIPDHVWNLIKPDGCGDGCGLLCISCIARRLDAAGFEPVPVWLCGTEPLIAQAGDTNDNIDLLRDYRPVLRGEDGT